MGKRKSCVFCGCDDCKISKEHAWPNWARQLTAPPGQSTIVGFRESGAPVGSITFKAVDDMGVMVNDVCKVKCNEGWMNDLETAIKPLLAPSIEYGTPISFNPDEQAEIARWALKTAMVFEFTSKATPFFTFEERDALRLRYLAPTMQRTLIWASHYRGRHMSLSHGVRIGFDMDVGGDVVPMDANSACISLGHFMFQTLTVRVPDGIDGTLEFPMEARWEPRTNLVWPPQPFSTWPPADSITDADHNDFLKRFAHGPILLRA